MIIEIFSKKSQCIEKRFSIKEMELIPLLESNIESVEVIKLDTMWNGMEFYIHTPQIVLCVKCTDKQSEKVYKYLHKKWNFTSSRF